MPPKTRKLGLLQAIPCLERDGFTSGTDRDSASVAGMFLARGSDPTGHAMSHGNSTQLCLRGDVRDPEQNREIESHLDNDGYSARISRGRLPNLPMGCTGSLPDPPRTWRQRVYEEGPAFQRSSSWNDAGRLFPRLKRNSVLD